MIDIEPMLLAKYDEGITIKELEAMTGLHYNTIYRVLHGQLGYTDSFEAVADALGFRLVLVPKEGNQ